MLLTLRLHTAEDTLELGRILAQVLAAARPVPALLLQGNLGSGKTTLIRGLVESLPGSELAEVSSPSFNIFNLYPTVPPVAHFDLYRLEGMPPDESLFEFLGDPSTLTAVEWIQFLDREYWPDSGLFLEWKPCETGRTLEMHAIGKDAEGLIETLKPRLERFVGAKRPK